MNVILQMKNNSYIIKTNKVIQINLNKQMLMQKITVNQFKTIIILLELMKLKTIKINYKPIKLIIRV